MAYVIPKCEHGRDMVQLFYVHSWVCRDECTRAVEVVPASALATTIEEMKKRWIAGQQCGLCGRSTRNVWYCSETDRKDSCEVNAPEDLRQMVTRL